MDCERERRGSLEDNVILTTSKNICIFQ